MKKIILSTVILAALCLSTVSTEAKSRLVSIAPLFDQMTVDPSTRTIELPVEVTRMGQGVLKVQLFVDAGLPAGSTAVFLPNPLVFKGNKPMTRTATLTITIPATASGGAYPLNIIAVNAITGATQVYQGAIMLPDSIWPLCPPILTISQVENPGGIAAPGEAAVVDTVLSLKAAPGRAYTFQATENLIAPQWVDIATRMTDSNGETWVIDPDADLFPMRFYRVVLAQ